MNERIENKIAQPTPLKINKIFLLILAVLFFVFSVSNVYLETRKQFMCNKMASQIAVMNLQTISSSQPDIDNFILRKEAFENICLNRTGIGSYLGVLASLWFFGYAITLFADTPKKEK